MATGWHTETDGRVIISIDDNSPQAIHAAELARNVVRARMGPVAALWAAEVDVVAAEMHADPVTHSAVILSLANLARLALLGWAADLGVHAEAPPTAEDLLDHLADACERHGWTI